MNRFKQLREESGSVNIDNKLVVLLYMLIRDHVQPADIEKIVMDLCRTDNGMPYQTTNGYLAEYAQSIYAALENR